MVSNPASTTLGTKAYDIFDLNALYIPSDRCELRLGVNNLPDEQPEIHGRTPGAKA